MASGDNQLTREELESKLKETTEILDKQAVDNTVTPEEQEEPIEQETPIEVKIGEPTPTPSETDQEEEEEDTPIDEEDVDYKEKYVESSKEGEELAKEKKQIDQALHEARNLTAPTEEDLKAEYSDWDLMSETEKRLAKDNFVFKKRFEKIDKADEERRTVLQWGKKVDDFIENPKTLINVPELEGKQDKFKAFAKDKKRQNISLDILVPAFLHEYEKTKVKHTGKMLEVGKGGEKKISQPNDGKISIEESRRLRETNYAQYMRMLQEGKIKTDID